VNHSFVQTADQHIPATKKTRSMWELLTKIHLRQLNLSNRHILFTISTKQFLQRLQFSLFLVRSTRFCCLCLLNRK